MMEPMFSLCHEHYPMNWDLPGEGYDDIHTVLSSHNSPIPSTQEPMPPFAPAYYPYVPTSDSGHHMQPPPSYETSLFKVHSAGDINCGDVPGGSGTPTPTGYTAQQQQQGGEYPHYMLPNSKPLGPATTSGSSRHCLKRRHSLNRTRPVFPESATPMSHLGAGRKSPSQNSLEGSFGLDVVSCADPKPLSPCSPRSSPGSPPSCSTRTHSLQASVGVVYADQIWRLDQEVLKLMSERAELLVRAQQSESSHGNHSPHGSGKVPLFLSRSGVGAVDAVLTKANTLLGQISELQQDFAQTVEKLLYNSTQSGDLPGSIQYIRGVLQPEQSLRISTHSGICHLSLDGSPPPGEGSKLQFYLDCVNSLLRAAQTITLRSAGVERVLGECQSHIQHSLDTHDVHSTAYTGLLDSEHLKWLRNVCHGNQITLHYSSQLWVGVCSEAKKAIELITSGLVA